MKYLNKRQQFRNQVIGKLCLNPSEVESVETFDGGSLIVTKGGREHFVIESLDEIDKYFKSQIVVGMDQYGLQAASSKQV